MSASSSSTIPQAYQPVPSPPKRRKSRRFMRRLESGAGTLLLTIAAVTVGASVALGAVFLCFKLL